LDHQDETGACCSESGAESCADDDVSEMVDPKRAIITVPAYFNVHLRQSAKDAYVFSGFNALR
jgi:hypothetical protein